MVAPVFPIICSLPLVFSAVSLPNGDVCVFYLLLPAELSSIPKAL